MKTKTNHRTPIRSVTIWLGVLVVCLISVSRAFPHPYDNQAATFFCDTTQVRSENAAANNPFTADAHWKIKNKPSGATRIRIYQGQYFDSELDLSYNRHRYFDARTGSFVSQDPLGLAAGDNVYSYAPNVWGWVDPLGLCEEPSNQSSYTDLTDAKARKHILEGDRTGGGHRYGTGKPGKSEFPSNWNDEKILHEISDVSTDPNSIFKAGRGGRTIVDGTRDGVDIRTVIENPNRGERIITGFPTNTPRNP